MTIIQEIMSERANYYIETARSLTPVVTGRMRASWRLKEVSDTKYELINDAPYSGRVLEYSPNAVGLRNLL